MKLNRNIWISIAIALMVCIFTLAWQRSSISAIRTQVSELESSTSPAVSVNGKRPFDSASIPSGSKARAGGEATAKQRLSIRELLASVPSEVTGLAGLKALPQLLESFEDYSAEELMAAVEEMNDFLKRDPSKAAAVAFISPMLTMIVSEIEPEVVFNSIGEGNDQARMMAFTGMAKKDPARAAELLDANTWPPRQVQQAKTILVCEWARTDVSKALAMIRDNPADIAAMSNAVIAVATSDPVTREKLWGALANEDDPAVRGMLSEGLVTSVFMSEGFGAAKEAFGRVEFADSEKKFRVVDDLASAALMSNPAATVEWISEVLPEDQARKAVAKGFQTWTETDYKAAADWLEEQLPSLERDYAIGGFARTAARIDPEAAVAWAMEIETEAEQKRVLNESLRKWNEKDPAAAKAWMQENEVTLEPDMRFEPTVKEAE